MTRPLADRIAHAEALAARYLGNYNAAVEAGRPKGAEVLLTKAQYWRLFKDGTPREWGDYGDQRFCGLRCGWRWACRHSAMPKTAKGKK